MMRTMQIVESK